MCFSCPVPFSSTNSSDSSQKIRWLTDTQRCERFQLCISKPLKPLAAPLKQCAQSLIFGCARQLSPSRGPWRSEWHHINGGLVLLGNSTGNHSCSWFFMVFHCFSWLFMVFNGVYSWLFMVFTWNIRSRAMLPAFFPMPPTFRQHLSEPNGASRYSPGRRGWPHRIGSAGWSAPGKLTNTYLKSLTR